ncbi:Hsp70 family protein [Candidatus Uabimicrobium sp. HlEnr_7]|uniref:Hsp70 family protein n=1 Tax=Candidatus Uabimicrobium helgolandensis TaxID=3095367 RepID=UPI0035577171
MSDFLQDNASHSGLKQQVHRLTSLLIKKLHDDPNFLTTDTALLLWLKKNIYSNENPENLKPLNHVLPKWHWDEWRYKASPIVGISIKNSVVIVSWSESELVFHTKTYLIPDKQNLYNTFVKIRKLIQNHLHFNSVRAVIAVPTYFNDRQRSFVKEQAKLAEIDCCRTISKSTATLLFHHLNEYQENCYAIIDFGSDRTDIAVVDTEDEIYETLNHVNEKIGIEDFDQEIIEWLIKRFYEQNSVDLYKVVSAVERIKGEVIEARIRLMTNIETVISVPCIAYGDGRLLHLYFVINRAKYRKLTASVSEKILSIYKKVIDSNRIEEIIVIGKMANILNFCLPSFVGSTVLPDEVIAKGAAIQGRGLAGAYLPSIILGEREEQETPTKISKKISIDKLPSRKLPQSELQSTGDLLLLDVATSSVGMEIDGKMEVLIPRNCAIPTEKFYPLFLNKKNIDIHILEGEHSDPKNNLHIGTLKLRKLAKKSKINIRFVIDTNGDTCVYAKNIDGELKGFLRIDSDRTYQKTTPIQHDSYFEKYLGEEAGNPGPIERIFCKSKFLMKWLQQIVGFYFILIAQIFDVIIDTVVGYLMRIYHCWKMYSALERRLTRDTPNKQLEALVKDFTCVRHQLSRVLQLCNYHPEDHFRNREFEQINIRFPLELAIETRCTLENMKQDLSLVTDQQAVTLAKRTTIDVLKSFIPNPVEALTRWKDFLVLVFFANYSRADVEKSYIEFVDVYRNLVCTMSCYCNQLDLYEQKWRLHPHEIDIVHRSNYALSQKKSLENCIDEAKIKIQKLIYTLFCSYKFISPRKWKRLDLIREIQKMKECESWQPFWVLEWERWLTNQVMKLQATKIDDIEKQKRISEKSKWLKRYKLQQKMFFKSF